ncbi:MAG: FHA domain-containing protein [Nitrospiria bacterium]
MFKSLIDKEEPVFSDPFKSSDSLRDILKTIREKEGLSTAVLVLEDGDQQFLLFILEGAWCAFYRLAEYRMTPLSFADGFDEASSISGNATLYRVSPVLFKALLVIAQRPPFLVLTNELIDVERLLSHLAKKKKEAVLVLKKKQEAHIFYFIEGILRDAYPEAPGKGPLGWGWEEQRLIKTFPQASVTGIEVFDAADFKPTHDCEDAMQALPGTEAFLLKGNDDHQILDENEKTPIPPDLAPRDQKSDSLGEKLPKLWVEVLTGSRAGFLIRVSKKPVTLGRGNVDVQLSDPQVSRVHAELKWTPRGAFIRDHNSTNGLFVNGDKVKRKKLRLNDEIRLGDIRLKAVPAS